MAPIGRNQPCPCGSGKKFKHCCINKSPAVGDTNLPYDQAPIKSLLGSETDLEAYQKGIEDLVARDPLAPIPSFREWQGQPNQASAHLNTLQEALSKKTFASKAEVEAFLSQYQNQTNQEGIDDFLGLSPSKMAKLLEEENPFSKPYPKATEPLVILDFQAVNRHVDSIPLLRLASWLLGHLVQGSIKLTAAGYLPTALVKESYQKVFQPLPFWSHDSMELPGFKVKRQIDLPLLDMLLPILAKIGLFKKRNGTYSITASGKDWHHQSPADQYEILFHGIQKKIDWQDLPNSRLPMPHPHLQRAWNFNLFILRQKADHWITSKSLGKLWFKAFPQVIQDYGVDPIEPTDPEGNFQIFSPMFQLCSMLAWYAFEFYPRALGLIEFQPFQKGIRTFDSLRTTELFHELITLKC